jgi:hypothetical protein
MTRISQIISVVGGVKADVTAQIDALGRNVTQPELLTGLSRTYRPRADDGVQLPPQSTRVQVTAADTLDKVEQLMTRFLNVTRTLDDANAKASTDVKVDGQTILSAVSTGHLFFLERELGVLHDFVLKIPVLDQATTWSTEGQDHGVAKTPPVETERTEKKPYNHVLSEATAQHPANVQVMARDEVVGYWTAVKFSGALAPEGKRKLLDRINQLREAVKFAREEANAATVTDISEGREIFDFLFRS